MAKKNLYGAQGTDLRYSTTSNPNNLAEKTTKLFPDFLRKSLADKAKNDKTFRAKQKKRKAKK